MTAPVIQRKDVALSVKNLDQHDEGIFNGALSVYGVVDAGGDVVERGAFTKTLKESGGKIPLLWQHDTKTPVGVLTVTDTKDGLYVEGEFNMDSPQAKQAHSMLKFMHVRNVRTGLSIGYHVVKDGKASNGVRQLKELRLLEGSLVVVPMNPLTYVNNVKSIESKEFADSLAQIQAWSIRDQLMGALSDSLSDAFWGGNSTTAEERTELAQKAIEDFKMAFMDNLPAMLMVRGIKEGSVAVPTTEQGRKLLETLQEQISLALTPLVKGTSDPEEAVVEQKQAAMDEPTDAEDSLHSWIRAFGEGTAQF